MIARIIIFLVFAFPCMLKAQTWSLDSCIAYAYKNNLAIKMSEQNIRLSEISETMALGNMLPSLNAQGGHGYNWGQRIDPFTNQFASERIQTNNFGIATSINLFNGFQLANTWRQAELNTDISRLDFDKARNDMALNVASAYLNVLLNKEFTEITKRTLDGTDAQVSRIEKLVSAGQLAQGNLNEILAQRAADNASHVSAKNNYELAKLSLMQLLQLDSRQMSTFRIEDPQIEASDAGSDVLSNPENTVDLALKNFPEVKSAQVNVASADLGKKIAAGAYYPSLNASFSYGTGYSGAARVLTGEPELSSYPIGTVMGSGELVTSFPQLTYGADDYSIKPFNNQMKDNINQSLFFTLNVPIFNGFSARSSHKRAEINYLNAQLQLEQTKQQLEQSVYKAHADALAALATYNSSKTSVEASQTAFDWVKLRYEQGVANSVEFNDARVRLENALATRTRSKYEYIFSIKVLEFYQGKTINLK